MMKNRNMHFRFACRLLAWLLIDGQRLAELMIEHNIGVARAYNYEIKRVDSDYFDEE
jgi:restriction endonuclease Mrr